MSKYTTQVRFICESVCGYSESQGFSNIDEIIEKAVPYVFDFEFPIFDEDYRLPLCKKILRSYYTREICEETVGLWKLRLSTTLNNIMPYYNQLYKSELLKFDPLYDVDITRTGNRDKNDEGKNNTDATIEGNNENLQMYSDTPQGAVTNLESGKYLTSANKNKGNNNTTSKYIGSETSKSAEEYIEKISGKQGSNSFSKLLLEFRKTFLNIDSMIIDELSECFFGLW